MPRAAPSDVDRVLAVRNHTKVFTPTDLGFNSVTWTKAGTNSFDIFVEGLSDFTVYCIADDAWFIDVSVYDEDGTSILFGPTMQDGGPGIAGGQVDDQPSYFTTKQFGFAQRIRLRGRGALVAVAHGTARLYARG